MRDRCHQPEKLGIPVDAMLAPVGGVNRKGRVMHSDEIAIRQVMELYVEGARTGRTDTLRPVFHELATICGFVGPDLFAGSIDLFYDWHDTNGPASALVASVERIDIGGTAATIRMELDNWTGHRFTDFFTLVKIDTRWVVLSKVFHMHA